VELDVTGIDRVLSNLIGNALDAVGAEGGRVVVRTFAPDPEHVGILVTDNGPGIDPEHRERIFDLLFSTKGSKGTGFGLAISLKIVNEHGGTIVMSSEPGEGAECQVTLPRA
jgi:signal transduction histidine kinase